MCGGTSTQEVQQSGGCARAATREGAKPGDIDKTAQSGVSVKDASQLCEAAAAEADARHFNLWAGNAFQRRVLIVKLFPVEATIDEPRRCREDVALPTCQMYCGVGMIRNLKCLLLGASLLSAQTAPSLVSLCVLGRLNSL